MHACIATVQQITKGEKKACLIIMLAAAGSSCWGCLHAAALMFRPATV
jgi:hypothetical protein